MIRNWWGRLPILKKTRMFAVMLLIVIAAAIVFSVEITFYSIYSIGPILTGISRCESVQEKLLEEENALKTLGESNTQENADLFKSAMIQSERAIANLPFDYEEIGAERYAKTWNLKNAYSHYITSRDNYISKDSDKKTAVQELYKVYAELDYLETYAQRLTQITVEEGSTSYRDRLPVLNRIPFYFLVFELVVGAIAFTYSRFFARTLVNPIQNLAKMARHVGNGDYSGQDLAVPNKDELGELVEAFNKMKHSMGENIQTLEKNHELSDRLHREEVGRIEMEKELDAVRLNLLQSQINPHFLFNTLNTIAGMAELESAETTEAMIRALSNLFRYNLHNAAQFVTLRQELNIIDDYMYLQKMRFGERIQYEVAEQADADKITVPVFLLQPMVENAIVHGLGSKEKGGSIRVEISMQEDRALICVRDTGIGITQEKLQSLTKGKDGSVAAEAAGIGIGNLCRRIRSLYSNGDMQICSKEGEGTTVSMWIPQVLN